MATSLTLLQPFNIDTANTFTFANVTITSNVTSNNANLGNAVTANYFLGNGSQLTGITASTATTAATVTTNAQPNITSVGTLSSLTISGNITSGNANLGNIVIANYHSGNGTLLSSINGSNISGQVGNSLIAGTVYTNAQPNITSVGTLTSLTITGNVTSGNANLGNVVVANYFVGNGSLLTGLPASYSNTNVASYLPTYTGNISANYFIGNGATLTNLTGGNVSGQVGNSLIAGTVYTNAQPNITSVGTLSSLSVTANVSAGNVLTNNLLYANGTAYSLGSGLRFTANTTPPATGNVAGDQWLNTSANVLYEYINDGTGNYWIDIQTPTISSSPVTTTDSLSPFLLMGA